MVDISGADCCEKAIPHEKRKNSRGPNTTKTIFYRKNHPTTIPDLDETMLSNLAQVLIGISVDVYKTHSPHSRHEVNQFPKPSTQLAEVDCFIFIYLGHAI